MSRSPQTWIRCPVCDRRIPRIARRCATCGGDVEPEAGPADNPVWLAISGITFFLLAGFLTLSIIQMLNDKAARESFERENDRERVILHRQFQFRQGDIFQRELQRAIEKGDLSQLPKPPKDLEQRPVTDDEVAAAREFFDKLRKEAENMP